MISGKVVGIVRVGGKTILNLENCPHHPKHNINAKFNPCPYPEGHTSITDELLNGNRVTINIGDSIWSNGEWLLWTPQTFGNNVREMQCGVNYDIKLKRLP